MREFAEQEIVVPRGPFANLKFHCDRQPFAGLWFDAIDSRRWQRHFALGPTQTGKTLIGSVIPILYSVFELRQDTIFGAPTADIISDKWNGDLRPVVELTGYASLLPVKGSGSKGGEVSRIDFGNGVSLRFMTAGGGDKSRASYTATRLVVTETDGFDESGANSREADKFTQLEQRLRADPKRAWMTAECTVSTENGRTWREYQAGTQSVVAIRCQHCGQFVTPERQHLVGWQDATTKIDALERGHFVCPSCGVAWTEDEWRAANRDCRLLHRGQRFEGDTIVGDPPRTDTFSMRWSAANNLFYTPGRIAADEWMAKQHPEGTQEAEDAEKSLRQFTWALPHVKVRNAVEGLEHHAVASNRGKWKRHEWPAGCKHVTVGIDIGKYVLHWAAIGWLEDGGAHVLDYAKFDLATRDAGEEKAIEDGLDELIGVLEGTQWINKGANPSVSAGFVDAGYQTDIIKRVVVARGFPWCCAKGVASTLYGGRGIKRPTGSRVLGSTANLNIVRLPDGVDEVEVNADAIKSIVHRRLGTPGHLTLYASESPREHETLARHLLAERKIDDFDYKRGKAVTRWEATNRQNHFLDAVALAVAAHELIEITGYSEPVGEPAPEPASDSTYLKSYKGRY